MELLNGMLSKSNLKRAYKNVVRNNGSAEVDNITIRELHGYLIENLDEIIT